MDRESYLRLMEFPPEWSEWGMLPEQVIDNLIKSYRPGSENGAEHDRHGVFQWWIRMGATEYQFVALARLSWLDPDELMGNYVRECMGSVARNSEAVANAIATPYHRAQLFNQADR
jgi:hypothetical protein